MIERFSVKDKVAIVTGGLGQLGTQFTRSLAEDGAKVAIFSRRPADQAMLEAKFPGLTDRIKVFVASVTDKAALEAATEELIAVWGVPHILVNNAGIDSKPSGGADQNCPFEVYPKEYWDEIIETNLTGVMLCCQVVGAKMAEARRGSIINVGSMYGIVSPNPSISYAASKSGLVNMTRYLATYWAEKNVRVNLVTFGGVKTATYDKEFIDAFLERVPMRRQAEIEEFSGVIHFLGSEASSYVTGANVVVDGGFTAW
jgi:NAD(P)-dependent dehydrogenase (short-subunit alcohol dehydrogenase family)